jgi:hypothetical protein
MARAWNQRLWFVFTRNPSGRKKTETQPSGVSKKKVANGCPKKMGE